MNADLGYGPVIKPLPKPDLTGFECKEQDGLRLFYPKPGADSSTLWTRDTIKYRSRVEDEFGVTVSQGFFKFFNLGTGPTSLQVTIPSIIRAAEENRLMATLKMDGSLLIRSVFRGRVMFRTRGSFGVNHCENAHELDIFYKKYPKLFDPTICPHVSLLMEWTSPNNVIVLKYPEPELTIVGAVLHWSNMAYMTMLMVDNLADSLQMPVVKYFKISRRSDWEDLYRTMDTENTIEGYVIRLHAEQDLVKIKCKSYLTRHGLKSMLSTEKLVDLWFQWSEPDFKSFCETFVREYDDETLLWAIGAISNFYDGLKVYEKILTAIHGKCKERATWTRKDAAIAGQEEYGHTKKFSVYMKTWAGEPISEDLRKSLILQNTKQAEISMFKPTSTADLDE